MRVCIGMWFKVKSTKLNLSEEGIHRIQNEVKGQSDISSKWNTRDMENPSSINLCTLMTFVCSLVLYLCTRAIFLSWLKTLENIDSIFCIFIVIFLASHLTRHLALNFSQSRCSVNINDWRIHAVSKSLLQLIYVFIQMACWPLTNDLCSWVVLGRQVC